MERPREPEPDQGGGSTRPTNESNAGNSSESPAALRIAEAIAAHDRGWWLVALRGKVPQRKGWTNAARATHEQVEAWATHDNVGVRCGESGLVVIDDDTADHSAAATLALPPTWTARTGSGGLHHYFRAPAGDEIKNSVGLLATKVDVRGVGGQCVLPGGVHPETGESYRWTPGRTPADLPLAPLPPEIVARLAVPLRQRGDAKPSASADAAPARRYANAALKDESDRVAAATEGTRNDTLCRAAFALGQLVGAGALARAEVVAKLGEASRRCGLPDAEAARTIESGLKAGEATPRDLREVLAASARKKKSPSLAELAIEVCTLFHDPDGEAYASFDVEGHTETWPVRSSSFRSWLGRLAFDAGVSGSRHAIEEAAETIVAQARYGGTPEREVSRRWAWRDGHLWYDLCNAGWQVVDAVADASGNVTMRTVPASECPVAFVRAPGAVPQVEPVDCGTIDELRSVLNVANESWTILRGALVTCFLPTGELPVIEVAGEENSGKTWTCQLLLELTDPSRAGPCPPPRELRDLYVRAKHRRVLALDNVSSINGEVSDALCRITTGSGSEERAYYTGSELETYEVRAPVVLNGIGRHVARPDLASRTLHVETLAIPREQQRERSDLLARWREVRPRVFGALLRAVAIAQARRDQVILRERPRLVDAARFAEAGAPALGLWPGEWTATALRQSDDAAAELVDDSPVARAISEIATTGEYRGSATDILARLSAATSIEARGEHWPTGPRGLSGALTRYARPLRDVGVVVERLERSNHSRAAQWSIRRVAVQRAERAEPAAGSGAAAEALGSAVDAPEPTRDAPNASESAAPSEGGGTSGASGVSFQPDVDMIPDASDADDFVDPELNEESPP
jgi:hypothetical protein